MRKPKLTPLQIAVHIGAWIPLAWLVWAYFTHQLSANPIKDAMQRTGRYALVLLVLSLACTPLNILLGWRAVIRLRRLLGLYAFLYAAIHFFILIGLDYQFNIRLLFGDLRSKVYIWAGVAAWLILLTLAATSSRWAVKRLGNRWNRLHRLVYLAGLLVILHTAWAKKGDLFRLRGDIQQPLFFGLLMLLLLVLRFPPVSLGIKRLRAFLSRRFGRGGLPSWLAGDKH